MKNNLPAERGAEGVVKLSKEIWQKKITPRTPNEIEKKVRPTLETFEKEISRREALKKKSAPHELVEGNPGKYEDLADESPDDKELEEDKNNREFDVL